MTKYYVLDLPTNKQYIGMEDCHLIAGNFQIAVPIELYDAEHAKKDSIGYRAIPRNEVIDYKL